MWVEKWRPQSFEQFVFTDQTMKEHIMKFVNQKSIPHLLFSGPPGTGKTTCARLLIQELGIDPIDTLSINASKENSAEVARGKIDTFCSVAPLNSPFKVVFLDEADYLSLSAQSILRGTTEQGYANVRFIMTCNYPERLKHAINSRIQSFEFSSLPAAEVATRIVRILDTENVVWSSEALSSLIERSPNDLRKLINMVEQFTVDGELKLPRNILVGTDIEDQVGQFLITEQWDRLRSVVAAEVPDSDIPAYIKLVYNNLETVPKFTQVEKLDSAILIVAEYLFRSGQVADQYINFSAMVIELKRV